VIAGTSGRPIAGTEVSIRDPHNLALDPGQTGEICLRGFHVMQGYFQNPEATREAIDAEGWLHTGDVGRLDEAGNLIITDRLKDMFIVGGFNCYPAEIEAALIKHPAIAQVAVIGIADERMGEVGCACVVLREGQVLDEAQLIAWSREQMANYKVPRQVRFFDALPLNPSSKVAKTNCARWWAAPRRKAVPSRQMDDVRGGGSFHAAMTQAKQQKGEEHAYAKYGCAPFSKPVGGRSLLAATITVAGASAHAAPTIELGENTTLESALTVNYTASMRTAKQANQYLNDPNNDDGTRNFKRGSLINNRLSLFGELLLKHDNLGAVLRGSDFYDDVYHQRNANDSPDTVNKLGHNDGFSDETRRLSGSNARLLDAYVYGNFEMGETQYLSLKAGRHLVAWGESLFWPNISQGQAPVDATKFNVPGTEAKDSTCRWDRCRVPGR
jgi:hypothetical protein